MKGNGKNKKYRTSFNALTEKTFGFNFEHWYEEGHWKDQYIPYSLLDGDKVISNVSVNLMNFNILGKTKLLIQLGTVMTDEKYRKQGLNKVLLNKVIADWQSKCEYIYLFANDSVLDFYPKFGFHKIQQYQCIKNIIKTDKTKIAAKLNMEEESAKNLVYHLANKSLPYGPISMIGNGELIMFYCNLFMKENVYYLPEYKAVVIAAYNTKVLEIFGILCEQELDLDTIIEHLATYETRSVKLYFTPQEAESYSVQPIEEEDTLFILGEDSSLQNMKYFMFPVLSHT
jgi:predicted N-acetyltransferase YhbS